MKLSDYMRENGLDDEAMASRIGQCTAHAVKKWKYAERTPRPEQLARIATATGRKVTADDFMLSAPEPHPVPEQGAAA